MANFNGVSLKVVGDLVIGVVSTNTSLRQTFYNTTTFASDGTAIKIGGIKDGVAGTRIDNPNQYIPAAFTGVKMPSYKNIFYNRILIEPNPLNVGNITGDTQVILSVFNAYFTPQTLNNVELNNLGGVSIGAPTPPTVYAPLQQINYVVDFLVGEGPPTIDGNFFFNFDVIDDKTVQAVGTRVLLFPYMFQPGHLERLIWATEVMTSNNGYEQRTKLRGSARINYSGNIAIPRNEIARLDGLMYAWRANSFGVPLTAQCRHLGTQTTGSDAVIDVDTNFADFRVGGLCVIYKNAREFTLFTISSVAPTQIESASIIPVVYGVGTLVMPVKTARLLSDPIRSTSGSEQRLAFNFLVTENTALTTTAAPDQYKGLDVYLEQPLTIDQYAIDVYRSRVDVVDYTTGVESTFAPWLNTKINREFGLQFDSQETAWSFRLWAYRRSGKFRPFWMPTFENNMRLKTTGPIANTFIIENDDQDSLSLNRDDIAIKTTSGWLFREVLSIALVGDDLLVTVDSALAVDSSEIEFISWMGRERLTSDILEINWGGGGASSVVPITRINN